MRALKYPIILGALLLTLASVRSFYHGTTLLESAPLTEKTTQKNNVNSPQLKTEIKNDPSISPVVRSLFASFSSIDENADGRFQEKIEELKKNPNDSVSELSRIYAGLAEDRYEERYIVVSALFAIESFTSYPLLAKIALSPLPEEKISNDPHSFTSQNEVVIRGMATEGLARLALQGHEEALLPVAEVAKSDDPTLARAAFYAYLRGSSNPEEAIRKMSQTMNPEVFTRIRNDRRGIASAREMAGE